jgi:hypothetical protein
MHGHTATYPPLNTLKPVAENVWIVDGPVIRFGMPWPKMPFPTRMTVVRLADGGLFLHSPTPFTEELAAEIDAAGKVRHLVGPNRIHYWWIPDWRQAYPQAETWLAPRIPEQAQGRIDFETKELAGGSGYPWDEEMDTLPVRGDYMTEFVFFHRASRTLIVTDLIENFEPRKLGLAMRLMTRIGGVLDPDGQMPDLPQPQGGAARSGGAYDRPGAGTDRAGAWALVRPGWNDRTEAGVSLDIIASALPRQAGFEMIRRRIGK